MNEFNNRIDAQREILSAVNSYAWTDEELHGLSIKAIERWQLINRLHPSAMILQLVTRASEKLYFLANKSQEQITPEYKFASEQVRALIEQIEIEARHLREVGCVQLV